MEEISFTEDILPLKDRLYRLALRITLDKADAEDIVQETLVRAWQNRGRLQDARAAAAFSAKVCRNLALDIANRAGRGNLRLDGIVDGGTESPADAADSRERLSMVTRLMDSLPEVQRSIMEMRDIEGMPYGEIAEAMGLSVTQVRVYLFRARSRIREEIRKMEDYGL